MRDLMMQLNVMAKRCNEIQGIAKDLEHELQTLVRDLAHLKQALWEQERDANT